MDPYRQHSGYPPSPQPGYPPAPYYQYAQTYQQKPSNGNSCGNCICMLVIFILIAGGVSSITFQVILHGNNPRMWLNSLNVSGLNITASNFVTGIFEIGFTIQNTDSRLHAYYDSVDIEVAFNDQIIGVSRIPRFDQPKMSQDFKVVRVAAMSMTMDSGKVDQLNSDMSKGVVKFKVDLRGDMLYTLNDVIGGRNSPIEFNCKDLTVAVKGSDGKIIDGSKQCDVDIRRTF